jgi:hypothetical protein
MSLSRSRLRLPFTDAEVRRLAPFAGRQAIELEKMLRQADAVFSSASRSNLPASTLRLVKLYQRAKASAIKRGRRGISAADRAARTRHAKNPPRPSDLSVPTDQELVVAGELFVWRAVILRRLWAHADAAIDAVKDDATQRTALTAIAAYERAISRAAEMGVPFRQSSSATSRANATRATSAPRASPTAARPWRRSPRRSRSRRVPRLR